ncbi:MAG: hypothetical protein D6769_02940 [Methanobacteriota archaeon]|nr:MAG: hypothetical protein D6769_02940 [Euryarchaeota archaeon]
MIKKHSKDGKLIIEVPQGSEVVEVKDNLILIILQGQPTQPMQSAQPTTSIQSTNLLPSTTSALHTTSNTKDTEGTQDKKTSLLLKLYHIPFKERKLSSMKGKISKEEVELLKSLISEGKLYIHKKGREKFIAFKDSVFKELKDMSKSSRSIRRGREGNGDNKGNPTASQPQQPHQLSRVAPDYAIVTDREAFSILEGRKEMFHAIKHFDGKVYIIKRSFFSRLSKKVKKALKEGPMHPSEISKRVEAEEDAVLAVLRFMNEAAEVIELKKGLFSLTD